MKNLVHSRDSPKYDSGKRKDPANHPGAERAKSFKFHGFFCRGSGCKLRLVPAAPGTFILTCDQSFVILQNEGFSRRRKGVGHRGRVDGFWMGRSEPIQASTLFAQRRICGLVSGSCKCAKASENCYD